MHYRIRMPVSTTVATNTCKQMSYTRISHVTPIWHDLCTISLSTEQRRSVDSALRQILLRHKTKETRQCHKTMERVLRKATHKGEAKWAGRLLLDREAIVCAPNVATRSRARTRSRATENRVQSVEPQ